MKKVVKIEFDNEWIFEHRNDDVLPVDKAVNILKGEFPVGVKIESSGFTQLTVSGDFDDADPGNTVKEILLSRMALENSDVLIISVTDVADEKEEPSEAPEAKASAPAPSASSCESKAESPKPDSSKGGIDAVAEKVDALVGCDDFKALVKELTVIAPQIKANKTFRSFSFQNYLFSINDGCGLTTYLNLFADAVSALGLFTLKEKDRVLEIKISAADKSGNDKAAFDEALSSIRGFASGSKIVCFDISEYMTKTDSMYFKSFLKSLEDLEDKYIFVFRTPFVENEILSGICNSIGDILYVRNVSFVPFSLDELHLCAESGLKDFGFDTDESAWKVFDAKISEEKSDGRFYGINTVNKIVNEIIYKKQLENALKNENNMSINSDDIMCISKTFGNSFKTGEDMMNELVGMEHVKQQIQEIVTQITLAVKNKDVSSPCIHMRFVGNPGTGKTTVARIIGKILCENGVLRNGHFFEYSGRDFCGRYIGETAPKTAAICRDAYGSVLFIDEAYSLYTGGDDSKDYGREALTTLIAEMENHRTDLVVIMAGYRDDMEILMHGNAGLASRMPFKIDFPNFTREELYNIFEHMVKSEFNYEDSILDTAKAYFDSLSDESLSSKEFSNARFVRNIYERTWGKAAVRVRLDKNGEIVLTAEDFNSAINDCGSNVLVTKKKHHLGF